MDYKELIGDLFGIKDLSTRSIMKFALNNPILGEAIALSKSIGFDARRNTCWQLIYTECVKQIKQRQSRNHVTIKEGAKRLYTALDNIHARKRLYKVVITDNGTWLAEVAYYNDLGVPGLFGKHITHNQYYFDIAEQEGRVSSTPFDKHLYLSGMDIDYLIATDADINTNQFTNAINYAKIITHLEKCLLLENVR